MLLPVIHSNNLQLVLKFDIIYREAIDLNIVGFDADTKTVFFNRTANTSGPGTYTLEFPMPVTPKKLSISFLNKTDKNENAFKVISVKCDFLPKGAIVLKKREADFVEFLKWFALKANHLPEGLYKSKDGQFSIKYVNEIITGEGEYTSDGRLIPAGIKLDTPARTDHETGEIQMARSKVRHYSVPAIMVIGEHEDCHFINNTMDESFCDLEALRICLGLGFPKTECIQAFSNIFEDTNENIQRIDNIMKFADNFKYAA